LQIAVRIPLVKFPMVRTSNFGRGNTLEHSFASDSLPRLC
jgi:hypothetical protein